MVLGRITLQQPSALYPNSTFAQGLTACAALFNFYRFKIVLKLLFPSNIGPYFSSPLHDIVISKVRFFVPATHVTLLTPYVAWHRMHLAFVVEELEHRFWNTNITSNPLIVICVNVVRGACILMPFMTSPNYLLTPPTWGVLGLGLATTIFSLGAGYLVAPLKLADGLGVTPTSSEGRLITQRLMVFLGARDLCIGATLLWFHHEGKLREMGVLITSASIVSVLDIWVAAQGPRGWDAGVWGLCGAAGLASFVGLGLLQS